MGLPPFYRANYKMRNHDIHLEALSEESRKYILAFLPSHLAYSNQYSKLCRILLDFQFLQAKLNEINVQALIEDYDLISKLSIRLDTKKHLKLIQDTLKLSAHILATDSSQLASQLIARLAADR